MAETKQITFDYKELAGILVKHQDIHAGLWGVFLKFGIQGANIGPTPADVLPAAIVPVLEIGIQRFDEPCMLTVDASEINAAPAKPKAKRKNAPAKAE